jgi:GAF domain-containing protein
VEFDIFAGNLGGALRDKIRSVLKSTTRVLSLGDQQVYYGLVLAFGLFFVLPSLGFINFAYKYDFFTDRTLAYYFLFVLAFSYLGFFILRSYADKIRNITENIERSLSETYQLTSSGQSSELNRIVTSFQHLLAQLEENNQTLETSSNQLRLLGELVGSTFPQMDSELLFQVGLQTACTGVEASRGTLFLLDESRRHHFGVASVIDSNGNPRWQVGDKISFVEATFRQAVLQKQAIFLADIPSQEQLAEGGEVVVEGHGRALAAPLMAGEDVIGVIYLEEKKSGLPFSSVDLDYALLLASCISYRYENLLRQGQLAFQTDQLDCLSALSRVYNLGLLRGRVFQVTIKELQRFMPVTTSFFALFDTKQEYFEILEVAAEEPVFLRSGMRLPLRQTLFSQVMQENQEIHREDITDDLNPLEARWFQELGVHSCYLAPFRIQKVNAGVLFVGSDTRQGFTSQQQRILQQVSEHLGLAVHNQILLRQTDEYGRELEVLNRLDRVLTSSLFDLNKVLDQVTMIVDRMIAVEAGAIYLRKRDSLVAYRTFGALAHLISRGSMPVDDGIFGYVVSRGEAVLVKDASQNPNMASLVKGYEGKQINSILCMPIVFGTEVVGVIHLWNKEYESFTIYDERVMRSVAANLATAVASFRLYRNCERLAAKEK